jgi:hypothetical protein
MGTKIVTPPFRGSYVNFLTPRKPSEDADPQYSVLIVLPKKDKKTKLFMKRLDDAIDGVLKEKFGKVIPRARLNNFPVKDGDDDVDDDGNAQFPGCWLIRATNKRKPGVIDKKGNDLFEEEDVYSGAWYHVSVSPWAWDHKTGGKGVSINLHNACKVKDDEKFTSIADAHEDFGELLEDGDDDDEEDEPVKPRKKDPLADLDDDDEHPF